MVIQRFRPYFSGQGVQLESLCQALARQGVTSTIVTARRAVGGPTEGRDTPALEDADGYRVVRLRCDVPGLAFTGRATRWWTPIFGFRTERALRRLAPDIDLIHVHGLTDGLFGAWRAARRHDQPILFEMTLLGTDDPVAVSEKRQLFQHWRESIYRRCDGYVAMSEALARRYRESGLPEERLRVIAQGVDTRRYAPADDRAESRRQLGIPGDGPLVAFVGSLIERKGIDVLLAAWERIHAAEPTARLLLVGKDRFPDDPAAERALDTASARLSAGARERVVRTGLTPDPSAHLRAADVFVFPSRREGFGSVIIEAMACALPCVVADLPGITDTIFAEAAGLAAEVTPGCDGFVVPQAAPAALADRALALIRSPELRRAVGARARARALSEFDLDRIAAAYVEWYHACLAMPRAR